MHAGTNDFVYQPNILQGWRARLKHWWLMYSAVRLTPTRHSNVFTTANLQRRGSSRHACSTFIGTECWT